jgi:hypothetical protein
VTQKKTSRRKKHPIEKIRISTPLHWTRPYIRRAIDKMPGLHLPTYVRSFKPTKTKLMRNLGNCYFDTKTLSIATHDQVLIKVKGNTYKVSRIVVLPRKKVLETIAHELAHLHYEDHGYEQDEFTKIIFKAFAFMEKCPICGGKGKVVADC